MNSHNCITSSDLTEAEVTPAQWNQTELLQRAGGLVREALAGQPTHVWRMHREDMLQTAVVAFLEQADQPAGYAYAAARTALKNYRWVHIRGLNGGWKSLVCIEQGYSVMNFADVLPEAADEPLDGPETAAETLSARQKRAPTRGMGRSAPPGSAAAVSSRNAARGALHPGWDVG